MRRKLTLGVLFFFIAGMMGCASLPKKFVRKKKEPKHKAATVFLDEGPYQKQFSNEYYYKTHYTLWRTWHDDMVNNLAGNSKKLKRAADEAYSHLEQMSRYLQPERQAKLEPLVKELDAYRVKFDQGSFSKSSAMGMRSDLERVRRLVANDFYFDKVKQDILPDEVDLGG
jgi:hypothetical protein